MHVVIFTGGKVQNGRFVKEALNSGDYIIAADCGAEAAIEFGKTPTVVLGDFDSLNSETKQILRERNIDCIAYKPNKDETDTELAINYAVKKGATKISILGGTEGNRIDHVIGNILLTLDNVILSDSEGSPNKNTQEDSSGPVAHQNDRAQIYFITGNQKCWVVRGPAKEEIKGEVGDILSLIPIGKKATQIENSGLKFPLKKESLLFGKTRGISNEFTAKTASVSFANGLLLFIQSAIK